ncbi:MAG: hypothetical protein FJ303_02785 [Planctomycetes bacterium]|nr:hypothetical protein [Planctomycetota bacterium]
MPGVRTFATFVVCILFMPASMSAQGVPLATTVLATKDAKEAVIRVRPNAPTVLQLRVKNPDETPLRDVTFKLLYKAGTKTHLIAQSVKVVEKLAQNDEVAIEWGKPDKGPEKTTLPQPPYSLELTIEGKQNDEPIVFKQPLRVEIREPRDYVSASGKWEEKRRAVFTLKNSKEEPGPRLMPLQLRVGPEFESSKKGTQAQVLTGPKQEAKLFCEDLAFIAPAAALGEGSLYIDVDGFERAFVFHPVKLAGAGDLGTRNLGETIGARIKVDRYHNPDPKFLVHLEMDGPLSPDYSVEIALDRAGEKKEFLDVVRKTGLRDQSVELRVEEGNLMCTALVKDWLVEFDTTRVFGNLYFRVGVNFKNSPMKLTAPTEPRSRYSALETEGNYVYARVNQDVSKPVNIQFVDLPKEWPIGKPLKVHVRAAKRDKSQAPIDEIVLVTGKLPPDGKAPPDAILGKRTLDDTQSECVFEVREWDKAEVVSLSARVSTKSGAFDVASASVTFTAGPRATKGTKVSGHVVRGGLGQIGLEVLLIDEKGAVKDKTTSKEKGAFTFESVAPGVYFVTSARSSLNLIGKTRVVVLEGEAAMDDVEVKLLVK